MDTTNLAKRIRTVYKARGWNSNAISVRSSSFSMGSAIDIEIKSAAVPFAEAKAIAESFEDVRRDDHGEILGGGNRFVTVRQSEECRAELAAPLVPAVQAALDLLADMAQHEGASIEGAPGFHLFKHSGGHLVKISAPDDSRMPYYYGIEQAASIAAAVAERMREPYQPPDYARQDESTSEVTR